MKTGLPWVLLLVASGCAKAQTGPIKADLTLKAADGKNVYADVVHTSSQPLRGVVLMFHQAGSNASEYKPIAPRIAKMGFDCVMADQRAGGDMFDSVNRTRSQYGSDPEMLSAYADLEAVLAWAKGQPQYKKIVVWGSSYSASLVLKLASEHPEVAAVLSFSPGEYFGQKGLVAGWNSRVSVPVLMAGSKKEVLGGIKDLYDTAPKLPGRNTDLLAFSKDGIHGSSTLRSDKCPAGAEYYWTAVEQFFQVNVLKG